MIKYYYRMIMFTEGERIQKKWSLSKTMAWNLFGMTEENSLRNIKPTVIACTVRPESIHTHYESLKLEIQCYKKKTVHIKSVTNYRRRRQPFSSKGS
jgi:hypothetical protein